MNNLLTIIILSIASTAGFSQRIYEKINQQYFTIYNYQIYAGDSLDNMMPFNRFIIPRDFEHINDLTFEDSFVFAHGKVIYTTVSPNFDLSIPEGDRSTLFSYASSVPLNRDARKKW